VPPIGDGVLAASLNAGLFVCPPLPAFIDEYEEEEGDFGSSVLVPDPL
jgi:hypothetical protein